MAWSRSLRLDPESAGTDDDEAALECPLLRRTLRREPTLLVEVALSSAEMDFFLMPSACMLVTENEKRLLLGSIESSTDFPLSLACIPVDDLDSEARLCTFLGTREMNGSVLERLSVMMEVGRTGAAGRGGATSTHVSLSEPSFFLTFDHKSVMTRRPHRTTILSFASISPASIKARVNQGSNTDDSFSQSRSLLRWTTR